jgi:hypothetical protein
VEVFGRVAGTAVNESSGVAASRRNPGMYWTHNDSGDTARLFAMGGSGEDLGVYELSGVQATDWEDIAVGPGPYGTSHIYVGDIGGNAGRTRVSVRRVAEPAVTLGQAPGTWSLDGAANLLADYPGGAKYDAEALFVDPANADIYIVTKSSLGSSRVFLFPASAQVPGVAATLVEVGSRKFVEGNLMVTGGDISPDGSEIVLRTYDRVYLWQRAPGQSVAQAIAGTPCVFAITGEAQGEAVGYQSDGRSLLFTSERANQPLRQVRR